VRWGLSGGMNARLSRIVGVGDVGGLLRWCWSGRVCIAVVLYMMAGLGDGVWSAFDASMGAGSRS